MSSITKGFNLNLTSSLAMPELGYINELAKEKNFEFGGGFKKTPPILEDLYYLFYQEREEGLEFDYKNHLFSSKTIEEELGRELNESEQAYYTYTLKFLEGLNYADCPGFSPMDKSLNVIMWMTYLSEQNNKQDAQNNPKGSGKQNISPESLAQSIKEMSEGVKEPSNSGTKGETETSKDVISCVRDFLYDLSPTIANIYGKEKVADVPINLNILKDIKVKSFLEEKVGLETNLERKLVENNSSKKKRITNMTSHSQIMKTNKSSMIMPNFDDKLAKKELSIKEKVKPETRKQVVTIMLDDSGSMNCIQKQSRVRATLMKFLEGVIDGKAEVNFYLFESKRYGYKKVTNVKEAQDLFQDISMRRPGGGGTHIGFILQETIDEIATDTKYHDPEIWIVNDGDDHVDPASIDSKTVKINAIMLGCKNENLIKVCQNSGGTFIVDPLYDRR